MLFKPAKRNRHVGQDSNLKPLACKSDTLPLSQICDSNAREIFAEKTSVFELATLPMFTGPKQTNKKEGLRHLSNFGVIIISQWLYEVLEGKFKAKIKIVHRALDFLVASSH